MINRKANMTYTQLTFSFLIGIFVILICTSFLVNQATNTNYNLTSQQTEIYYDTIELYNDLNSTTKNLQDSFQAVQEESNVIAAAFNGIKGLLEGFKVMFDIIDVATNSLAILSESLGFINSPITLSILITGTTIGIVFIIARLLSNRQDI